MKLDNYTEIIPVMKYKDNDKDVEWTGDIRILVNISLVGKANI